MRVFAVTLFCALAACGDSRAPRAPVTVFAAASLARPLAAVADSFKRAERRELHVELGGSLEQARKITDLGRVPDVLMLVDDDVMASLVPAHLDWYVRFATNRIGVVYTDRSRFADSITPDSWWRVITRPGMRVGRADPNVAPVGRHALAIVQRLDAYYKRRGLTDSVMTRAGLALVRPNATELAALLETGEVDYILDYESVAKQYGFRFVALPDDLAPPILYGLSVPRRATNADGGLALATYLLSDAGQRLLRDAQIRVLDTPVAVGANIPPAISSRVRTADAPAGPR